MTSTMTTDLAKPLLPRSDATDELDNASHMLNRMSYLCAELAQGNAYSPEQLRSWQREAEFARIELDRIRARQAFRW